MGEVKKNKCYSSFLQEGLKVVLIQYFSSRIDSYMTYMIKTKSGPTRAFTCDPCLCLAHQTLARIGKELWHQRVRGSLKK